MPRSATLTRDLLLAVLGLTTGACDAAAFEHLGNVFASVVTGDLVLLGISLIRESGSLVLFAGCGLLGYSVGVLITAPRSETEARPSEVTWPPSVNRILVVDLLLLIAFGIGWQLIGAHPGEAADAAVVLPLAAAMGAQSSAVRRIGPMSTTYLTSTLTGVLEAVRARRISEPTARGLAIIAMAVVGAAIGTAFVRWALRWLPLAPPPADPHRARARAPPLRPQRGPALSRGGGPGGTGALRGPRTGDALSPGRP